MADEAKLFYSDTQTTHTYFPADQALEEYNNGNVDGSWDLMFFDKDQTVTFTNVQGVTISSILIEGVTNDNNSANGSVTIAVGNVEVTTGNVSWLGRQQDAPVKLSSYTINSLPEAINAKGATFKITPSRRLALRFTITYTTASEPATSKTIYLHTGGSNFWNQANPVFIAHTWEASDGSNVSDIIMTPMSCNPDIYTAEISIAHNMVIFLREKTGTTTSDDLWTPSDNGGNLWNRTAGDIAIPTDGKNQFHINAWDNGYWELGGLIVTFNPNASDATGSMPTISDLACDASYTIPECAYTREDNDWEYSFTGWNTAANGSGTTYQPGNQINLTADLTLYAQWKDATLWALSGNFPCSREPWDFLSYEFQDKDGVLSVDVMLDDNTTYEFKMQHLVGSTYTWYSNDNNGTFTSDNCTNWAFVLRPEQDQKTYITSTLRGIYTFTLTFENGVPHLSVIYPAERYEVECGELMRATLYHINSNNTNVAQVTGLPGTAECKVQNGNATDGFQLGAEGDFIGLTLPAGETFQQGDRVVVYAVQPGTTLDFFPDKNGDTDSRFLVVENVQKGINSIALPAEAWGKNAIYLYRTSPLTNAHITYMAIERPCCTSPDLAWATTLPTECDLASAKDITLSVTHEGNGTVTYQSNDRNVATISGNTLHFVGAGQVIITAFLTADVDGNYCDDRIDFTINVTDGCGTHHIIYNIPVGKDVTSINPATVSVTPADGIVASTTVIAEGVSVDKKGGIRGQEPLSVKISNTTELDRNKYLAFEYTVPEGKCFVPCAASVKIQPVSKACSFLVEMTDGTSSITQTLTNYPDAVVGTLIANNNNANIAFTGKVQFRIYSYGAETGYRLGSPIHIYGTLGDAVPVTLRTNKGVLAEADAAGWTTTDGGATYTKYVPVGGSFTFPTLTLDGYTFTVFHSDDNARTFEQGSTITITKALNIHAHFRANTPEGSVYLELDPNGGTIADATGWTYESVEDIYTMITPIGSTITFPAITREGYYFGGYTDEDGRLYAAGSTVAVRYDYHFTAQWCNSPVTLEWRSLGNPTDEWEYNAQGNNKPELFTEGLPEGARISYTSSNSTVALIRDNGIDLVPLMSGTTTITARYDGDGEHCPATASYTLIVDCPDPAAKLVADGYDMNSCNESITLRVVQKETGEAYPEGYTFMWYNGTERIQGATSDTYIAQTSGKFFAVVHGDCYTISDTATITASVGEPIVQNLVPFQYFNPYHDYSEDDVRYLFAFSSPIANEHNKCEINVDVFRSNPNAQSSQLWNGFIHVAEAPETEGPNKDLYLVTFNPQELEGQGSGLEPGDSVRITLTPYNDCHEPAPAYARSIYMRVSDKPALAFVVSGSDQPTRNKDNHKVGGDFLYGVKGVNIADLCEQSGEHWDAADLQKPLPLLTDLRQQFEVVPVNGYAPFNKYNYDPFDLVFLTDFIKTDGGNNNETADYVNELANLVDYRPIFSLKGHMAKEALKLWQEKGFKADPQTPSPNPQNIMTVLCYAHGIFSGLPEGDDPETSIQHDANDNITVQITSKGGFDANKALQGFASTDSRNFVNIASIPNGDGTLIACLERQENVAARMIVLSVNADATSFITPIGRQAIISACNYLLVTDPAAVSDCSVTFDNDEGNGDHLWTTAANWNTGRVPMRDQNIQIIADCQVNTRDAVGANLKIKDGVHVEVLTNAVLSVTGQIEAFETSAAYTKPTTADQIILRADKTGTAALIHNIAEGEDVNATVELYSKAYTENADAPEDQRTHYWQYIGIPVRDVPIPYYFRGAWTYVYSETQGGWIRRADGTSLHADFQGYATSQPKDTVYTLYGPLADATDRTLPLTMSPGTGKGENLIGNSWTAPIRIDQFEASDFGSATATVYIYNTGRDDVYGNPTYAQGTSTAGQWLSIPVNIAKGENYTGLKVIPAMQAFQVNTGVNTSLMLDYDRLVRSNAGTEEANTPLRAPSRTQTIADEVQLLRVTVTDSATHTDLYLAEHETFSDEFDNGWEATFIQGDGRSATLYALSPIGDMAVLATDNIDGTTLAFRPGRDNTYTFSFGAIGKMLYLNDMQERTSTLITDWDTYTFTAREGDMLNRFCISSTPFSAPDVSTSLAEIVLQDDLLKLSNPAGERLTVCLYDPAGRLCYTSQTTESLTAISLPATQGVYILSVQGGNTNLIHKVTR